MKKLIFILIFALLFILMPKRAEAMNVSAQLVSKIETNHEKVNFLDMRVKALENVFKRHNSPLADEAWAYVKYADEYGTDWRLLPAISGLESSFGIYLMPGSYNAYGWGGGHIYFESWEDGIRTINKTLAERYYAQGATDVWSIGPIYAESPTWAVRVDRFMHEIDEEYRRLSLFSSLSSI